jgi:hypothetical protein
MDRVTWNTPSSLEPGSLADALRSRELADHLEAEAKRHRVDVEITLFYDATEPPGGDYCPKRRCVSFLTGSAADPLHLYFVVLHEIGHAAMEHIVPRGAEPILLETVEREAWVWAIGRGVVEPNAPARQGMARNLNTYLTHATRTATTAAEILGVAIADRWPPAEGLL